MSKLQPDKEFRTLGELAGSSWIGVQKRKLTHRGLLRKQMALESED